MKNKGLSVRELTMAAGLAAFSAVVQLIHVGYQSPQFGMWIDIVAVTWIMALFLFGARVSLFVSFVGAVIITLFAPDTWLGASMKLVATLPILILLAVWLKVNRKQLNYYQKPINLFVPLLIAVIIRCLLVIPLNYYYAIPIWTGMSSSQAMVAIPWYIIALFNVVQSILDVVLAWILVFRFKLDRFASWK